MWSLGLQDGKSACHGLVLGAVLCAQGSCAIGREVSGYVGISNSEISTIRHAVFLEPGKIAVEAQWTNQEGGGRPLPVGTGSGLADSQRRLDFPCNFNRVSAINSNGCAEFRNAPVGGGDVVTGVSGGGAKIRLSQFRPE